METQVKELANEVRISFMGLKRDLRDMFNKVLKMWLIRMARDTKGENSHEREARGNVEGEERGSEQEREIGEDSLLSIRRLVSWNMREVCEGKKRRVVKELDRRYKIDVLCLQETKCEKDGESIMGEIGGPKPCKGWLPQRRGSLVE